ncbi:MAG: ABC transporter permease [Candidatus Dormibacteraeota bacterium]|nr:ABC transporter permease [Candidatus Dormibacteraeota bacterium]
MTAVLGAFTGQWLKLVKRPAVRILAALLMVILIGLGYLLGWLITSHLKQFGGTPPRGETTAQLVAAFHPRQFLTTTVQGTGGLGSVLVLILGALMMGSEYGWGTMKTAFTQRPGRLQVLAGWLLALAAVVAILAAIFLAVGAACSVLLGLIDRAALDFPPPAEVGKGFLVLYLTWGWAAMFGLALAVAFRQSALALGIGLAEVLVLESLVFGILTPIGGERLRAVERFFPGPNGAAFTQWLGSPTGAPPATPVASVGQAALVLGLYVVAAIALSAVILRRRDEI